jgi:hypothetical protein
MILGLSNVSHSHASAGRLRIGWQMPSLGGTTMPGNQAIVAIRALSPDDKRRLAEIIANMLQPHLNTRRVQATETANVDQSESSAQSSLFFHTQSLTNQGT